MPNQIIYAAGIKHISKSATQDRLEKSQTRQVHNTVMFISLLQLLKTEKSQLNRSKHKNNVNIKIMGIIHSPDFYLKHGLSETGFLPLSSDCT
jgi:hypothetical protein